MPSLRSVTESICEPVAGCLGPCLGSVGDVAGDAVGAIGDVAESAIDVVANVVVFLLLAFVWISGFELNGTETLNSYKALFLGFQGFPSWLHHHHHHRW